ncbi:MAG: hypothetical protein ACREV4_00155, partial [Gammaproteobacteria bacterium]
MKKSAALGISRCILGAPDRAIPWPWLSGGARTNPPGADWERNRRPAGCAPGMACNNPHVFHYPVARP